MRPLAALSLLLSCALHAQYVGGIGSGYDLLQFVAPQAITTGPVTGPICAGSAVSVTFTAEAGFFNPGNVFTAQLSDAGGGFATPTAIGTINGTAGGTIPAIIPSNTAAGSGYRIRVVSSDPVVPGTNNGQDIAITAPPLWYPDLDNDGFGAGPAVQSCTQPADHVANNLDCDDGNGAITTIGQSCDDGLAGTVNDVLTVACVCEGISGAVYNGGVGSGYDALSFIAPQAITTGTVNGPICAGAPVAVPFSAAAGFFNAGNVFTAQLSNASGGFDAPTAIGTLSGAGSGSIDADIPAGTPAGSGYRIRVISSDPVVPGTNNGADIIITVPPLWYADADDDGFGAGAPVQSCTQPADHVANNFDCDDTNAAIGSIGQSCDDGNAGTVNDVLTVACVCQGISSTVYNGGIGSGYDLLSITPPPQLTTGSVIGPLCAGGTLEVPFLVAGSFNVGNTFTAELSDAAGSFASPTAIGTAGGTGSGSINAVVPAGTAAGSGYRIRVVGSAPTTIGSDNGTDLLIAAPLTWYADTDGDTYGDLNSTLLACAQPSGYVPVPGDCDNSDPLVNPLATEVCNGQDDDCDGLVDEDCQLVSVRTFLEGPYDPGTGLMNDALRVQGLLPATEPYTGLGYVHTGGGGEAVAPGVLAIPGADAAVDWVLIELRDAGDASIIRASRSALVQRDGDVVDVDGTSPVTFTAPAGNYRVAVRHRNHLGAMTALPIALSSTTTAIDLTQAVTATFGTAARKSITGAFPAQVLWTGDVTFNGQVQYTGAGNDRDPILVNVGSTTPNNVANNVYSTRDVNLNGNVQYTGAGNDRDPILVNVGSITPNNVRPQQLP